MLSTSLLVWLLKLYGSYALFLAFMLQSSVTLTLGFIAFVSATLLRLRWLRTLQNWQLLGPLQAKQCLVLWREGRHFQVERIRH